MTDWIAPSALGEARGPAALTASLMEAWHQRSADGLAALIHQDAVLHWTARMRGQVTRGRDSIVQSLMDCRRHEYPLRIDDVHETSSTTGTVHAFARLPLHGGGFSEGRVTGDITLRDELLWRTVLK